jgi:hypothetical protein
MDPEDIGSETMDAGSDLEGFDDSWIDLELEPIDPDVANFKPIPMTKRAETDPITTDPFQYEPLDLTSQSFRLLRLRRAGNGINGIECTLFDASFEERENVIAYEALSYVWGSMKRNATLIVNK